MPRRILVLTVLLAGAIASASAVYSVAANSDAARTAVKASAKTVADGAKLMASVSASCAAACANRTTAVAAGARSKKATAASTAENAACTYSQSALTANGPIDFLTLESCTYHEAGRTADAGASCQLKSDATAAAVTPKGGITGNFESAMSGVCQSACAARIQYDEADLVHQPGVTVGDLTQCPVSGVVFKLKANNASVSHGGTDWYTCCGSCAGILAANPERFVRS